MAAKKCLICNCSFSGRRDAKTCSPRCRKRLQIVRHDLQVRGTGSRGLRKAIASVVLAVIGILFILLGPVTSPANAAASSYLNFQARLLSNAGAVVADGTYNVEFKVYDASSSSGSSQGSCSGDADCLWVETRTGADKVRVVNGYLTVNLGSVTAFASTIKWDQQMWLTMNIGGTGAASWDGEMSPRIQLTALPYSFYAGQLASGTGSSRGVLSFNSLGQATTISLPDPGSASATVCYQNASACGFLTSTTGVQLQASSPGTQQTGNFNVSGTGIVGTALQAPLVQTQDQTAGTTNSTAIVVRSGDVSGATSNSGAVTLRSGNSSTSGNTGAISIKSGDATSGTAGSITIDTGTTTAGTPAINIGNANAKAVQIGNNTSNPSITIDSGTNTIGIGTGAQARTVNIATGGAAQTVTLGSTNTTSSLALQGGVNGANETVSILTATSGVIGIGTNNNSATINIGSTGLSTGTQTISIGNTNTSGGTTNITIGTGASATAGSTTLQSKGTLALGNAISPTINVQGGSGGTINIGDNAVNKTITIGATSTTNNTTTIHVGDTTSTGGAQTIAIGGTGANNGSNTSTTAKVQAGQTSLSLANTGATLQTFTNSTTALQIQNSSAANIFVADSSNSRIGVGVTYTALSAPTSLTATPAAGGSLTAGAYRYEVTAIDSAGGETAVSNEPTCTTATTNLTCSLSWTAPNSGIGVTGYRIYRTAAAGASNSEKFRAATNATSYSDTCAATCLTSFSVPLSSTPAYTASNTTSSQLQLTVGDKGSPTGQLYVSGTLPTYVGATDILSSNGVGGDVSMAVQGRYAYTVDYNNGVMQIIDINNPARPVVIKNTSLTGTPIGIVVQDKYAYITTNPANSTTLYVYDISNPNAPVIQGAANSGLLNTPVGLYVQGRYAYVAGGTSATNSALLIFDVIDPAKPLLVGMINAGMNMAGGTVHSLYVQGNYAYVAAWSDSKLYVFDVTNPASPTLKGTSATTNINNPFAVSVQGRYAYIVSNGASNLAVYDVSDPANPTSVGTNSDAFINQGSDLAIQGRYAYVTAYNTHKILVYDITNPVKPVSVGQNSDSFINTTGGSEMSLAVQGRYAYVAPNDNNGRFYVYDLGGAYIQQLEAGGASFGTLSVNQNGQVAGDFSIQGGVSVGASLQVAGNVATTGGTVALGSAILGTSGTGFNALGTPGTPTIACAGTGCPGATTRGYKVTAVNAYGGETAASTEGTVGSCPATITTTIYCRISWTAVTGAAGYKIYRTTASGTPATTGLIATINSGNTTLCGGTFPCFDDKNQFPVSSIVTTAPTIDTTGQLTVQGSALFVNKTDSTTAFQIQNATGATTFFSVDTSGNVVNIGVVGSANINSTIHIADSSSGVQTITVGNTNSTSAVTLQAGTGRITLKGQLKTAQSGTALTNSSLTESGAGTPTICSNSTDTSGCFTTSTTSHTTVTLTFAATMTNAPFCLVTPGNLAAAAIQATAATSFYVTTSATTMVVNTAADTTAAKWYYWCVTN